MTSIYISNNRCFSIPYINLWCVYRFKRRRIFHIFNIIPPTSHQQLFVFSVLELSLSFSSPVVCQIINFVCLTTKPNHNMQYIFLLFVLSNYNIMQWTQAQNFPVSRFNPISTRFFTTFPRFFTNKIFQGSQVWTLR